MKAGKSTTLGHLQASRGPGGLADRPRDAVRESLGWPLTLYFIGLVVVLTLVPFNFTWPVRPLLNFHFYFKDVLSNVFLFLPLGFLLRLCLDRSRFAWRTVAFCLVLSSAIELLQLLLPSRVTSPIDVASNATGAWFGALACDFVLAHLNARRVREMVFELPIATVFYLLVPLFWLNSLLTMERPDRSDRIWATIPLGVIGGLIVGSIVHHRLASKRFTSTAGVVTIILGWFAAGNALNLLRSPKPTITAGAAVVAVVSVLLLVPNAAFGRSRRFEQPVLLRVLPLFLAYLFAVQMSPWTPLGNDWAARIGLAGLEYNPNGVSIAAALRLVEQITAYTILGYILAGLRGRTGESRATMLSWVGFTGGLIAAACGGLRGFHPVYSASLGEWILAVAASVYGAFLYRMHLRTVWRILGRLPAG